MACMASLCLGTPPPSDSSAADHHAAVPPVQTARQLGEPLPAGRDGVLRPSSILGHQGSRDGRGSGSRWRQRQLSRRQTQHRRTDLIASPCTTLVCFCAPIGLITCHLSCCNGFCTCLQTGSGVSVLKGVSCRISGNCLAEGSSARPLVVDRSRRGQQAFVHKRVQAVWHPHRHNGNWRHSLCNGRGVRSSRVGCGRPGHPAPPTQGLLARQQEATATVKPLTVGSPESSLRRAPLERHSWAPKSASSVGATAAACGAKALMDWT